MAVKIGNFKGKPTIALNAEETYPFSFGTNVANLIVDNIEAIREFVQDPEAAKKKYGEDKRQ